MFQPAVAEQCVVRFQNNIQSIFSRVRLLYGSTPLEDIPNYNVIVRALTEWTGSDAVGADQTSITDGIGGIAPTTSGQGSNANAFAVGMVAAGAPIIGNVRQKYIHGIDTRGNSDGTAGTILVGSATGFGCVPNGTSQNITTNLLSVTSTNPIRRYQVQLALGMLTQEKLIPTKFMASQLAIEITLASPEDCIYYDSLAGGSATNVPTYKVLNMNLIPEILEFDASYDESFLRGLQQGGVPIKFSTWNNYRFTTSGASSNLQIQERSRSVKSIFCLQRRPTPAFNRDSGASFFNTDIETTNGASTLQDYQFRIGGR